MGTMMQPFVPKRRSRTVSFADGDLAGLQMEIEDISTGDMLALMEAVEGASNRDSIEATTRAIASATTRWNMCDPGGTPVPVSYEALLSLPIDMLTKLCTQWFASVTGSVEESSPLESSSPSTGPSAGAAPELPMEPL